tara:strand:+ start:62 stop:457 length:396 start_codon:yes stop_codon:yes gene_type:complete
MKLLIRTDTLYGGVENVVLATVQGELTFNYTSDGVQVFHSLSDSVLHTYTAENNSNSHVKDQGDADNDNEFPPFFKTLEFTYTSDAGFKAHPNLKSSEESTTDGVTIRTVTYTDGTSFSLSYATGAITKLT